MSIWNPSQAEMSETEAADELGITVQQLHDLVSIRILDGQALPRGGVASLQAKDLLALKLLLAGGPASIALG